MTPGRARATVIGVSCALAVALVGVGLTVYFLTRSVRNNKLTNYMACANQQLHGIISISGQKYWLGTLASGISLYTAMTFPNDTSAETVPYTLTALGMSSSGSGAVACPMIGNVADVQLQAVTPPPIPATFQWSLLPSVTSVPTFWGAVGSRFTPIVAVNGQQVAQLAVVTFSGAAYSADACFLCTPGGTAGWPLCVVGGLLWTSKTAGPVPTTPPPDATFYNLGFMPLAAMLGAGGASAVPAIGFLNCYPQIPLLGYIQPPAPPDSTYADANLPNRVNANSNFGTDTPKLLGCMFSLQYQTSGNIPPQMPPDSIVQSVLGCHAMGVPAFDMVPADDRLAASTLNFMDAMDATPSQAATAPTDVNLAYAARVGTTSGLTWLRLRAWKDPQRTDYGIYARVLQHSNPSIDASTNPANPYVSEMLAMPAQYARPAGSAPNATTLLYPPATTGPATLPWTLGLAPTDLCQLSANGFVIDPAETVGTGAPPPLPPDEPILAIVRRGAAYERGGTTYAKPYELVIGWGAQTGNTYLRCGGILTQVAGADVLNGTAADAGSTTCATCTLPQLRPRTVCWPTPRQAASAQAPVPQFDNMIKNNSQLSNPVPPGQGTTIIPPTDPPVVALGATVGPTTMLDGGHAAPVMQWIPLLTAPTGDAGGGYGRYNGSTAGSAVWPNVRGSCPTIYTSPPSI